MNISSNQPWLPTEQQQQQQQQQEQQQQQQQINFHGHVMRKLITNGNLWPFD